MNRFQLEHLYEVNGLNDYRLRSTDDLLKTHGIDFSKVKGYNSLDAQNKQLYAKFIVNLFNGLGLDSRLTMIPKGIYFVEDIEYLAKVNPEDDYFMVVGGVVQAIDKNRSKRVHKSWQDDNYKHLKVIESETKTYLRFEYKHNGRNEWLHVIGERTWY